MGFLTNFLQIVILYLFTNKKGFYMPVKMGRTGVSNMKTANEFLNCRIKKVKAKFVLPVHGIKAVFKTKLAEEKNKSYIMFIPGKYIRSLL